ncbi:hypothetical protein FKN93_00990 [Vibrio sp. A8-1]|uniref:hypothetical protein n=1 Tax=Vibrio sp. A8-1 TaxID=2591023 RepID=UPI00148355EB|nr:hypothetical protein [Vibrio sp. A8-1]EKO3579094.1 hypothetical protein [Vibrio metschnikovii]EKO3675098.1 hypothetical protein [Vibrio metschnikovii]NNN82639.1 hypothetical protein [Vibrio sp. A8-1]
MFWELIATFSAGLGAAGIALLLRAITLKKLPNWIIPVFAGAGMLGFQIYSEYTWFSHQRSLLPAGVEVIRTAQESSGWRPWSYLYPQTLRFVAADINNASVNQRYSALVLVDLYFFERRMHARRVHQVVDCEAGARADFSEDLQIPATEENLTAGWYKLAADDRLLLLLCQRN